MGGQPSTRGKNSIAGKFFTGVKPTWLQHQQDKRKVSPIGPSIPTTTGLYIGHTYLGVVNPLWAQPNTVGIPPQGTMPYQSVNPTIVMHHSLQSQYMGDPLGRPHLIKGPSGQFQYVGGPSAPSQYMGGQTG
jgi:hypothetical protein